MKERTFKKIIYTIIFIITYVNLFSNLYNVDGSLILDSSYFWSKIALNRDSTNYYGLTSSFGSILFKILIPLLILFGGGYSIYYSSGDIPLLLRILLLISITIYLYSTYKFNMQDNGNVCYITQLSILTDKDKNIDFYFTHIYKFLYLIGLIGIFYKYNNLLSLFIYFIAGLCIQSLYFILSEIYSKGFDLNYNFEEIKHLLYCSINNQFGLYLYLIIISIYLYLYITGFSYNK